MSIAIRNKRRGETGIYVGRPSPLGNPHPLNANGSNRAEVIRRYRDNPPWKTDPRAKAELERLARIYRETGRLDLLCWCTPLACHAEVIRDAVLALAANR